MRASCSRRCWRGGWVAISPLSAAAQGRDDAQRAGRVAGAQVARRDGGGLAADLLQRRGEGGRLQREVGAGAVGAQLAVAREQAEQQEAHGVHDEADEERDQHGRQRAVVARSGPCRRTARSASAGPRRCRPTRPPSSPARRGGRRGSARGPGPPRAPRRRASAGSRSSRRRPNGRATGRWRRRWAWPCRRCRPAASACRPGRRAGRSSRAARAPPPASPRAPASPASRPCRSSTTARTRRRSR